MRVAGIIDHGTIIQVILKGEDDTQELLYFDHSMFRDLWDNRRGSLAGECHVEGTRDDFEDPQRLVFDVDVVDDEDDV